MLSSTCLLNCSLPVLAKEFLYYATKALGEDVTPYIHIQGAHAAQLQSTLPYPIGRLKNAVKLATGSLMRSFDLQTSPQSGQPLDKISRKGTTFSHTPNPY